MRILVTGGTGFIGQHLVPQLLDQDYQVSVLTRSASKAHSLFGNRCHIIEYLEDISDKYLPQAVINLAGAPIAEQRWTDNRKQLLKSSRISFTRQLVEWLNIHTPHLQVFISGSAIGYYGSQSPTIKLNEDSKAMPGFTHELCSQWEQEAAQVTVTDVRICFIRTGIVLGQGGALAKMLPAFRFGLGGPIASGEQMMSWIHVVDVVRAIVFILQNKDISGPCNLTAPIPVSNKDFALTLAKVIHRPAWFTLPEFVVQLMLGEGAELLVEGQQVLPDKLLNSGFNFAYDSLQSALVDCC